MEPLDVDAEVRTKSRPASSATSVISTRGGVSGRERRQHTSSPRRIRTSTPSDGDGILRHLLGDQRQALEAELSLANGLDTGSTGRLLTMLAPIVMGVVGQAQRRLNLDSSGLAELLSRERIDPEPVGWKMVGDEGANFDVREIAMRFGRLFRR